MKLLFDLLQGYLLLCGLYLLYPLLGFLRPVRRPVHPKLAPLPLAVLIAAHDEESVIEACIRSLKAQDYTAFDVYVVADNCTDRTAELARRSGARVHVRTSEGNSTKGQALAWLWRRLPRHAYGGVLVLDADNVAEKSFLRGIAGGLASGADAVQGLRRAKNPQASPLATLDALSEALTHRIGAAGRTRLGLNAPLMGSGVGFSIRQFNALIRNVGDTLVEDLSWQAEMAVKGGTIAWSGGAAVLDEKTSRTQAMGLQRARWLSGRMEVTRRCLRPLLGATLRTGNLSALDLALFLLSPPRVITLIGLGALFALSLGPGDVWPPGLWLACLGGFAFSALMAARLEGLPLASLGCVLWEVPRFAWQMALGWGRALFGKRVPWVASRHGG